MITRISFGREQIGVYSFLKDNRALRLIHGPNVVVHNLVSDMLRMRREL